MGRRVWGPLFPVVFAVLAAVSCFSLRAQAPAVLPPGASDAAAAALATAAHQQTVSLLITQVFGFLALLSGLAWKGYTEARDRRWARQEALEHRAQVMAGLAQAKAAAQLAYVEANNVNAKIASVGLQLMPGNPSVPGIAGIDPAHEASLP